VIIALQDKAKDTTTTIQRENTTWQDKTQGKDKNNAQDKTSQDVAKKAR
jgi:hypothetical protein